MEGMYWVRFLGMKSKNRLDMGVWKNMYFNTIITLRLNEILNLKTKIIPMTSYCLLDVVSLMNKIELFFFGEFSLIWRMKKRPHKLFVGMFLQVWRGCNLIFLRRVMLLPWRRFWCCFWFLILIYRRSCFWSFELLWKNSRN